MISVDWLILALAVLNMAGIVFSICERYRQRQRWLPLIKERAALEVLLRDEFHCAIQFRHEGEILHVDVHPTKRPHGASMTVN